MDHHFSSACSLSIFLFHTRFLHISGSAFLQCRIHYSNHSYFCKKCLLNFKALKGGRCISLQSGAAKKLALTLLGLIIYLNNKWVTSSTKITPQINGNTTDILPIRSPYIRKNQCQTWRSIIFSRYIFSDVWRLHAFNDPCFAPNQTQSMAEFTERASQPYFFFSSLLLCCLKKWFNLLSLQLHCVEDNLNAGQGINMFFLRKGVSLLLELPHREKRK